MIVYFVIFGIVLIILSVALISVVNTISNIKIKVAKLMDENSNLMSNQAKITKLLKIAYKRLKDEDKDKDQNFTSLN